MTQTTYPSLRNRVIIVTGGGRGLGRVMALALVDAGANVVITGARAPDELDATVADGRSRGRGRIERLVADVSDRAACDEVVTFAADRFGPVEVLVNNAARAPAEQNRTEAPDQRAKFWMMPHEAILRMLATNVGGVWAMAQAVLPGMIERGRGKIVNISTSRPTMVYQTSGIYGPCKAAVEASSRIWARELDGTGVTVNVLLPGGPADTALIAGPVGGRAKPFAPGKEPPGREGFVDGLLPPEIMASPILWLASDASDAANGRRYVARDWDDDLPPDAAAARAEAPRIEWPHII